MLAKTTTTNTATTNTTIKATSNTTNASSISITTNTTNTTISISPPIAPPITPLSSENQALIVAITEENKNKIETALTETSTQKKADINCPTSDGPPLVYAIKKCNLEIIKLLVEQGADLNLTWVGEHLGTNKPTILTVMEYACQYYDKVSTENKQKLSNVIAYFFEQRPHVSIKTIEIMLDFYLASRLGKTSEDRLLEDYVLSHFTYCNLTDTPLYTDTTGKEKNILVTALLNLDATQHGALLGEGAPHCLLYYVRIAGIFKTLVKKSKKNKSSDEFKKNQDSIDEINLLKKTLAAEIYPSEMKLLIKGI